MWISIDNVLGCVEKTRTSSKGTGSSFEDRPVAIYALHSELGALK